MYEKCIISILILKVTLTLKTNPKTIYLTHNPNSNPNHKPK